MSSIRKDFFGRIVYIGLSIVPCILFSGKGPERFIAVASFLFGMYHMLMVISMSQDIIDDFSPPKNYSELRTKTFDKLIYWFATALFWIGIIATIIEIGQIENTIHGTTFFWICAIIGILMATAITVLLKFTYPSVYFESNRRYTVYFGLFLGLFLTVPASASLINRYFSDSIIQCNAHKIIRKETGGKRDKSSWIYIHIAGQEERFEVTRPFWESVKEGESVVLCTKKGKLGYEFVEEFKVANLKIRSEV